MSEFRIDKLVSSNGQSGVELPKGLVGVVTATSGFSGDLTGAVTGNVTGNLTGTATTATNLADGANITTGTISNDRLPTNINVSGVITATSFSGDGSALTGIDATSLKDSGDTIRVQANTSGAVVTGVLTASTSIEVGDAFLKPRSVGLGTTNSTGRDAGIGTATGEMIYNTSTQVVEVWNGSQWKTIGDQTTVISASGGSESTAGGYKIHTFTGSAETFTVTSGVNNNGEYLVIGGGGGGGYDQGGGGGAGGVRTSTSFTIQPGTYTIQVGGGQPQGTGPGNYATPSFIAHPEITTITAGGGEGGRNIWTGGRSGGNIGTGDVSTTGGNGGGDQPDGNGGGGGGAGHGGNGTPVPGPPSGAGPGGPGTTYAITRSPFIKGGGGGGGNRRNSSAGSGGPGGGGNGGYNTTGSPGSPNTGGGGGGGSWNGSPYNGGSGGSGIVIIAYPTS